MDAGHIWIEGTYLHWTGSVNEKRIQGALLAAGAWDAGHIWIGKDETGLVGVASDDYNYVHYIDEEGDERIVHAGAFVEAFADDKSGFIWVDDSDTVNPHFHYISGPILVEILPDVYNWFGRYLIGDPP